MTEPTKCPEFHCKLAANHVGPHICAALDCAVNPRPAQDYNELLISQAGGDANNVDEGNNVDITLKVKARFGVTDVDFTNVPMHRVHATIAALNGDTVEAALYDVNSIHPAERYIPPAETGRNVAQKAYDKLVANSQYAAEKAVAESRKAKEETRFAPPSTRAEDFTSLELFGEQTGVLENTSEYDCGECGAIVYNRVKHVTWHNKTLP